MKNLRGTGSTERERPNVSVMLKLMGGLMPVIVIVIAALILMVRHTTSNLIVNESNRMIEAKAASVVHQVEGWMEVIFAQLDVQRDTLEHIELTPEQEVDYIRFMADPDSPFPGGLYFGTTEHEMVHGSWAPGPEFDPTTRGWYQDGIQYTEFRFGAPYLDAITKAIVVPAMGRLRNRDGTLRGAAAGDVELDEISKIVSEVQIEETGSAFLLDTATSTIIGAKDGAVVGLTLRDLSGANGPLYAAASTWITQRSMGMHTTAVDGKTMKYYLSDVGGGQWTLVCFVPEAEILRDVTSLTARLVVFGLIAVVALSVLAALMLYHIVVLPVRTLDQVAHSIAGGNLDTRLDYSSRDEFGALAVNFQKTVERLHSYIGCIDEVSGALDSIANGNLTFRLQRDYSGEFSKLKTSLEHISDSLNDTILRIDQSSRKVSMGAEQLSNGSRSLSQGAAEQAAAVEDLSSTITELSGQVHKNAVDAKNVSSAVSLAAERISQSNERMQMLIRSMVDISSSSMEIDKIIKMIEDIAFQTNILALNAAVEAARAGAAGKGFAVVADEVRNLASKSAEAAQNTAALIRASETAVKHGSALADETAETLLATVGDIQSISQAVNEISLASDAQASSIEQASDGIQRISSVIQSNSAASEETAASSQELSAQAQILNAQVEKFQIRSGR